MQSLQNRYKKILCVRADNMGDVLMSAPAMRALKQTFQCHITLLTSPMGALITPYVPEADDTMICDIPWVKTNNIADNGEGLELVQRIKKGRYDAAIIFTVYSQSALPAAMLLYLAGVPVRVAYCRENPYCLLTHWVPDKEPYTMIRHQVERDLYLVAQLGANTTDERLAIDYQKEALLRMQQKLEQYAGVLPGSRYIVLHPAVSEAKREYPAEKWSAVATALYNDTGMPVIITGAISDSPLAEGIAINAGEGCYALAGRLSMEEWIALIADAVVVVSVNTASVHIAAAVQTPVVVLYALTNPQHTPWMVQSAILPFSVIQNMKSNNEVIRYVDESMFNEEMPLPSPDEVVATVKDLLMKPSGAAVNRSILFRYNPGSRKAC